MIMLPVSVVLFASVIVHGYDSFYDHLAQSLLTEQSNTTHLFSSEIHLNIVGRLSYTREELQTPDTNFFVSTWIAQFLWEIRALNITDSIAQETDLQLTQAINEVMNVLQLFRNKNTKNSDDLSVSFWAQKYERRCDYYCAAQGNIEHGIAEMDAVILFLSIEAAKHGINITDIMDIDYYMWYATEMFDESFGIPADNDDTSVALALTTFYKENANQFNTAANIWLHSMNYSFTSNIQSFMDILSKYNYKPMSDDMNYNYIDPRSYYWLRHFIYESLEINDINNGTRGDELIFVTTWQLSYDVSEYNVRNRICYQEPFAVNNVEATVGANVVYGITRSLIWFADNREQWFNAEIQQIYRNTTNMLIWIIDSEWINKRPELIFLYYPSRHDFYWFLSRTYNVFRNYMVDNDVNKQIMNEYPFLMDIYNRLESVLQNSATEQLLNTVTSDNETQYYFWDDFIGNDDLNVKGEADPHYDDRLFSTAMAVNALLNIWSVCDVQYNVESEKYMIMNITWSDNVPQSVRNVIDGAILFLRKESFNNDMYRPENAFFSGSHKTKETGPWYYPINVFQLRNGTIIDWKNVTKSEVTPGVSLGVSGFIGDEMYQEMINDGGILGPVPVNFTGYNQPEQAWPYWSSYPITRAATLLAVGKYDTICK